MMQRDARNRFNLHGAQFLNSVSFSPLHRSLSPLPYCYSISRFFLFLFSSLGWQKTLCQPKRYHETLFPQLMDSNQKAKHWINIFAAKFLSGDFKRENAKKEREPSSFYPIPQMYWNLPKTRTMPRNATHIQWAIIMHEEEDFSTKINRFQSTGAFSDMLTG